MPTTFHKTENEAAGQLASEYRAGDGTLVLGSGQGARFGSPSVAHPIWITARSGADGTGSVLGHWQATGRSADTLTSVTVASGYTDRTLPAATWVRILWSAEHVDEIHAAIVAAEGTLATKADDAAVVHLAGNESITATKTFTVAQHVASLKFTTNANLSGYGGAEIVSKAGYGVQIATGSFAVYAVDATTKLLEYDANTPSWTFAASVTTPTLQGSQSSAGDLEIKSTSHTTKGKIKLDGSRVDFQFNGALAQAYILPEFGYIYSFAETSNYYQVKSTTGPVNWLIYNAESPNLVFRDQGVARNHAEMISGATSATALTTLHSGLTVEGPTALIATDYADDTAAAGGGVPVGGVYRTGSALKIRVS